MIKCLFLLGFWLFYADVLSAQSDSVKQQINNIKLDESYLFGEAKDLNGDLATAYAVKDLLVCVNAFRCENKLSLIEEKSIDPVYLKLSYRRGDLTYVFTYLKKKQALEISSMLLPATSTVEVADIDPERIVIYDVADTTVHDEILQNILERQMIDDVYGYLQNLKKKDKIAGFAVAKGMLEIPDNAMLIIYNRMHKVVAVLTEKVNEERKNIRTNKPDRIFNYSGHGVLWYINK